MFEQYSSRRKTKEPEKLTLADAAVLADIVDEEEGQKQASEPGARYTERSADFDGKSGQDSIASSINSFLQDHPEQRPLFVAEVAAAKAHAEVNIIKARLKELHKCKTAAKFIEQVESELAQAEQSAIQSQTELNDVYKRLSYKDMYAALTPTREKWAVAQNMYSKDEPTAQHKFLLLPDNKNFKQVLCEALHIAEISDSVQQELRFKLPGKILKFSQKIIASPVPSKYHLKPMTSETAYQETDLLLVIQLLTKFGLSYDIIVGTSNVRNGYTGVVVNGHGQFKSKILLVSPKGGKIYCIHAENNNQTSLSPFLGREFNQLRNMQRHKGQPLDIVTTISPLELPKQIEGMLSLPNMEIKPEDIDKISKQPLTSFRENNELNEREADSRFGSRKFREFRDQCVAQVIAETPGARDELDIKDMHINNTGELDYYLPPAVINKIAEKVAKPKIKGEDFTLNDVLLLLNDRLRAIGCPLVLGRKAAARKLLMYKDRALADLQALTKDELLKKYQIDQLPQLEYEVRSPRYQLKEGEKGFPALNKILVLAIADLVVAEYAKHKY